MKPGLTKRSRAMLVMILLLFMGFAACIKDHFNLEKLTDPEFKPSLAVPLISSELNLLDILEKTNINIQEDPDTKLITLIYETRNVFSQIAEDIMQTPDQHYNVPEVINYVPPLPGEVFTYEYSTIRGYTTEIVGQRMDSLFFKAGILTLQYTSDIEYAAVANTTSPSLREKVTGLPLLLIKDIIPGANNEIQVELKDYYMIFAHDQLEPNSVSFDFVLEIAGSPGALPTNYQFDTDVFLTDVRFQKMIGYFGQYNYSLNDTMFFDVFDNLTEGYFQLDTESVNLEVEVHNSYGMPIWLGFNPFFAYSPLNPPYQVFIHLFGPSVPNEFLINAPGFDQMGQSVTTILTTQSNIGEAVNLSPQYIHFGVNGISNPENDPSALNFVLDTSIFSIDIITRLELFGLLDNFILQDTLAFNIEVPDELESAEFKVRTVNGFPLEVDFQAFFVNAAYQVVDSLITDQIPLIEAAPVGPAPELKVTQPVEATFLIPVSKEKLKHISQAEYMIIKGVVSSTNKDNVRIYSDYSLNVRLSAILNTHISP
jgi:hypothetical protein